ncbi:NAD(P)/FAD-dependent oxidoreductase [Arcanobacterium hippocoleae]|uniref:NAD(P)/FAD-dependent oxidoreductase n=1 Tax=Arcanobacterium hippocoleae TaxID=149017 RepID=UPI00333F7E0F
MVGAGVAGSVAAIDLARKGHNVALIERGQTPGEKIFQAEFSIRASWSRFSPIFSQQLQSSAKLLAI